MNLSNKTPFTSRGDLHVHSKYSDRPSEWILRRIGAPECFVEPAAVYERAIAHGMDFVTISDHNVIDGALEIAHLPNTFISCEVTAHFPENGAGLHILVSGINEKQFEMIDRLRKDVYALREYLVDQDIVTTLAHPLFLVNGNLTIDQYEKTLIMFNRFEIINGTRDPRAGQLVKAVLDGLTPRDMERLIDKHGIDPIGPNPHRKAYTGGSDDHSGLYTGSAHTVTPTATSVEQYLDHLRHGRCEHAGRSGTSVHLAHCFYTIAYGYYKQRFLGNADASKSLLGSMLRRMLEPKPAPKRLSPRYTVRKYVGKYVWRQRKKAMSDTERMLVDEFTQLLANDTVTIGSNPSGETSATEAFEVSCKLVHGLGSAFFRRFTEQAARGDLIKSLEALGALAPVAAAVTPYLAAFATQHKDERFVREIANHFPWTQDHLNRSQRRGWFTDTFDDVNGVARTIRKLSSVAAEDGRPMTVMTCVDDPTRGEYDLKNFEPVGQFKLPEYEMQRISFPPVLEIIEYVERKQFEELIISTPGPMGLTALLAAKLMHLRTVGIYHTDFPNYIREFTGDAALEAMTWRYMIWFFSQCDSVFVPSEYYRRYLVEHGFDPNKISILRRGVETDLFNPSFRTPSFWTNHGGRADTTTFTYVGRMSSEKNVELLLGACETLAEQRPDWQFAFVGDGPLLESLRRQTRHRSQILFTGNLHGEDLSTAYASSDVFVFPSTTDTFGNVVLEAQASGVPAIVTDRGGPCEIVGQNNSGIVCDVSNPNGAVDELIRAMIELGDNPEKRRELGQRALENASTMSWPSVLDTLWNVNEDDGFPTATSDAVPRIIDPRSSQPS
ncbi:MAG: glycosyltransferase [Planctomycetota bacterium]